MSAGALAGVRVVDLTRYIPGPYATMTLADLGADVVKIERPGFGDIARYVGVSVNGTSALYTVCNRGKRSIAIDLQKPEARNVVLRLAAGADVFVENYRPGVLERLELIQLEDAADTAALSRALEHGGVELPAVPAEERQAARDGLTHLTDADFERAIRFLRAQASAEFATLDSDQVRP